MWNNIEISIVSSVGSSIGSSTGSSIASSIGSNVMSNIGRSIGSGIGGSIRSSIGYSIGSSIIGISIGSKEIVTSFLYSRILGKGLLIRFFDSNILCRTYCKFSELRIVALNRLRKILNSNTHQL